jgi:hypothetical protein
MIQHETEKAFTVNKADWVKHTLRHTKKVNGKWEVVTTIYYRKREK